MTMLRYPSKRAFIFNVREMNRIGIADQTSTPADGAQAEAFVRALGTRSFHQESVKCPKNLEINLHDLQLNVVWVTFAGGALDLTTIDCRAETPVKSAQTVHRNLAIADAVRLIDEFFATVAPPRLPAPPSPTAEFQRGDKVKFVSAKNLRNPHLLRHLGQTAEVQWTNEREIRIVFDDRNGFQVKPHHLERIAG